MPGLRCMSMCLPEGLLLRQVAAATSLPMWHHPAWVSVLVSMLLSHPGLVHSACMGCVAYPDSITHGVFMS
jgi:hypothetical protein